jgi:hypothetical protein
MRSLLALAALALTSCAVPAQVALQGDGTEQATTVTYGPDQYGRHPATGSLFVGDIDPGDEICRGIDTAIEIPCRDVVNACIPGPDHSETMFHPWTFYCTPDSPTMRDVCATTADEHLAFYGYTREECDALSGT